MRSASKFPGRWRPCNSGLRQGNVPSIHSPLPASLAQQPIHGFEWCVTLRKSQPPRDYIQQRDSAVDPGRTSCRSFQMPTVPKRVATDTPRQPIVKRRVAAGVRQASRPTSPQISHLVREYCAICEYLPPISLCHGVYPAASPMRESEHSAAETTQPLGVKPRCEGLG